MVWVMESPGKVLELGEECWQHHIVLMSWLCGNTWLLVRQVAVHWARLVLRWVTQCTGMVYHLGMQPATRSTQPSHPSWVSSSESSVISKELQHLIRYWICGLADCSVWLGTVREWNPICQEVHGLSRVTAVLRRVNIQCSGAFVIVLRSTHNWVHCASDIKSITLYEEQFLSSWLSSALPSIPEVSVRRPATPPRGPVERLACHRSSTNFLAWIVTEWGPPDLFSVVLKLSFSFIVIYPWLRLIWNVTTWCLAVCGAHLKIAVKLML